MEKGPIWFEELCRGRIGKMLDKDTQRGGGGEIGKLGTWNSCPSPEEN